MRGPGPGLELLDPLSLVEAGFDLGRSGEPNAWVLGEVIPALHDTTGVWCDHGGALVPFGRSFDHLLVPGADGVRRVRTVGLPATDVATVGLDECVSFELTGSSGETLPAAQLDLAVLALAAELTGVAEAALDLAVRRVSERTIFGRPIGTYQAVAHRLVDDHVAATTARLAVMAAASGHELPDAAALLAVDAALVTTATAHQVHGGEGYLEGGGPGTYYRRARSLAPRLGGRRAHLARLVRLAEER